MVTLAEYRALMQRLVESEDPVRDLMHMGLSSEIATSIASSGGLRSARAAGRVDWRVPSK